MERAEWLQQMRDKAEKLYDYFSPLYWVKYGRSVDETHRKYLEKFLELVNQNVTIELNKIGLEVINVNIRDITDESGYIDAIGKRAAAEAINQAKVEVADAHPSLGGGE